ncbi:hypothetical protein EDC04DRAFT_366976 [Pisolithus marmoratus]|nr:hypothetical protein EDC04DRAFT_366976 [Pisolithus marmoratus]
MKLDEGGWRKTCLLASIHLVSAITARTKPTGHRPDIACVGPGMKFSWASDSKFPLPLHLTQTSGRSDAQDATLPAFAWSGQLNFPCRDEMVLPSIAGDNSPPMWFRQFFGHLLGLSNHIGGGGC